MAQHKQDSKTGVKYDAPNEQKEFEDTKGVTRTRYEEQTTQWSKEKGQRTNNHLQSIHIKLKIE